MRIPRISLDLRIAFTYLLFGAVWIITSDYLLERWAPDIATFSRLGQYKGIAFVLLSAALIYFVAHRDLLAFTKVETDLRKSENLYHLLADNALDVIWILDTENGRFRYISPSVERLRGYSVQEALEQSAQESLTTASWQKLMDSLPPRIDEFLTGSGKSYKDDLEQPCRNGDTVWVETHSHFMINPENGHLEVHGVSRDITERKEAERNLRESETRFRTSLNRLIEGCQIIDFDWRYIYVNDAAARQLGGRPEQLLMRTVKEVYPGIEGTELSRVIHYCMTERVPGHVETELALPDGSTRSFELSIQPIPEGLFVLSMDRSERKLAEQALKAAEERYHAIFDGAVEGIFQSTPHGQFITANPALARMWGYTSPQELIESIEDIARQIYAEPSVRDQYVRALQDRGEVYGFEYQVRRKDGRLMWVSENARVVRDTEGKIAYFEGSIEDITLSKQAADELRISENRYRGLFEDSPISLWEEDFSEVKLRLDALREAGVTDIRAYFQANPAAVMEFIRLVKVLDVNKATMELQQVTSKAELLTNLGTVFGKDAHGGFITELENIAAGRTHFRWEGVNYTHKGNRLDVSMKWTVAPGHENDLSRVLISIVDITKSRQTESAIKESEARYRGLFENSPIALREEDFSAIKQRLDALRKDGVTDFHLYLSMHPKLVTECAALARVIDVNNATLRQYGATSKEELLTNLGEILEGDAFEHFTHQLADLAAGQTRFRWEGVDRKLDKSLINVDVNWSVAPGHEEDLSRVIVSIMDITDRKQAEEALRSSEEKYRKLFSEMLAGCALQQVILEDGKPVDYVTLDANSSFERLVGVSKESVIGKKASGFLPPAELKQWLSVFGPVALEGTSARYEIYSPLNQKYFEGNAFCPEKGICAVTFSDVTDRKHADERIQQQLKRITALRDIDRVIASSLDLRLTLNRLLIHVTEQLQLDAAAVLLFSPHTLTLEYYATRGFQQPQMPDFHVPLGAELAGQVAMERKTIHLDLNEFQTSSGTHNPLHELHFTEYYGLPLVSKGQLRGVLEVYHRGHLSPDAEWLDYLDTLAGQAAVAIDNIQLFDGLQRSNIELAHAYDATIEGWSRALDMRDKETEGHTRRVTELTIALAREFGFSGEELTNIRWGALLHDIGKMGIPDAILLKPGPLTEDEWTRMKQHPQLAYELLSRIQYLHNALDIPRYHHEKWDGTGYPHGLKREQIPLAARIFAVVDIWDALRADRPYRPAWSPKKTLQHIRELSGTHLDPKVVQVFMDCKIHEIKVVQR